MPSSFHEAPLALFRECPALVPVVLRDLLGVALPPFSEVRVEEADFAQLAPAEFRADLVVTLAERGVVMGVIVEVQRQVDGRKRFTWPLYAAALHARIERPVCLLVLAGDEGVARWAAEPTRTILGSTFAPLVVGPDRVPWVGSEEEARRSPELAVLSAIAHGNEPGGIAVVLAALAAAAGLDEERMAHYNDMVLAALSQAALESLEREMQTGKYEYRSEFAKKYLALGEARGEARGEAKGKVEGKAEAVLAFLSARGIPVTAAQRDRVRACTEIAQLDRMIARAATCATAAEALGEG